MKSSSMESWSDRKLKRKTKRSWRELESFAHRIIRAGCDKDGFLERTLLPYYNEACKMSEMLKARVRDK